MNETLVILGTHPFTRIHANFEDGRDYIVFNEAGSRGWPQTNYLCHKLGIPDWKKLKDPQRAEAVRQYPKWKRDALLDKFYEGFSVLQIHQPIIFRNKHNKADPLHIPGHLGRKHYEWLQRKQPFPIYMQEDYPDIPSAVRFPIEDAKALISKLKRIMPDGSMAEIALFGSSVDYAIALGILKGYKKIEIIGVEMATDTEYSFQRPAMYFWSGVAAGMGVEIIVSHVSVLFEGLMYGYEGGVMIDRQKFESAVNKLTVVIQQANSRVQQSQAILMQNAKLVADEKDLDKRTELVKKQNELLNKHIQLVMQYGSIQGALAENQRYLMECDKMIAALGGSDALQKKNAEYNYSDVQTKELHDKQGIKKEMPAET